jgi:hypothetical protein
LSCECFEDRRTEHKESNNQIDFDKTSEPNMKKICIRRVPKILSSESEMGRKEILLFRKIEELDYLKILVTSHEIMSQCNSEIKCQKLLRLTEASISGSKVNTVWISSFKIQAMAHYKFVICFSISIN